MIAPGSRYTPAVAFTPAPGIPTGLIRPRPVTTVAGVIEHTVTRTDRLDLMARHYYNDPRRWWLIVDANPDVVCGADIEPHEAEAPRAVGNIIQIPAVS